jgi:isocitrate dehydrogenase (NAD+)
MLRIVVVLGDGVGPEIVSGAVEVVEASGVAVSWEEAIAGEQALVRCGEAAPGATLRAIRSAGAALKGPFHTPSGGARFSPNIRFRHELKLFANLRVIPLPGLPRPLLLVRENLEDLYAAVEWSPAPGVAKAVKLATVKGCERIAHRAFAWAGREQRRRVTVVHKANNLKLTEGMFLRVVREVAAEYAQIEFRDLLVDAAATELILHPEELDVILTSNTYGDILSGVGVALAGSPGLVASLNRGDEVIVGEAAHGDAVELVGTGRVNPVAMVRSAALLMRECGYENVYSRIEAAIVEATRRGATTPDLGGSATTREVIAELVELLRVPVGLTG